MCPRQLLHAFFVSLPAFLVLSCERQATSPDIDPITGRQCFAVHQARLPPGTQYEGYEVKGDRISVKMMTGVELKTVDCALNPDGTLDLERTGAQDQPGAGN
ncbi:MAG: hypothetical protein U9Q81_05220 [Pseudomonadota bacterium]|nr:hypothetical protein [Pseudomonadota bacterium]